MKGIFARLTLVWASLIVISLMLAFQSSAKIDNETIVGMWLFDEDTGDTVKDSSGNKNDGKFKKGPKRVAGKFGLACELDGTSYVEVPFSPSLS